MLVDVALVVALAELARAASGSLAQHGSAPAQSPWALAPGGRPSSGGSGSGICPPKLWYDDFELHSAAPNDMVLHPLHISGGWSNRVDLTFFADGYTVEEEAKFVSDAKKLTADIVASGGAMADVAHLLNVYGVFVASSLASQVDIHTKKGFGIGTHDTPLNGSAFGLYRPGPELRAVYVQHPGRARAACAYWRSRGKSGREGGCDQPILLGNDALYGGLGGEFTIITASELNGPLVLRHELGHSLIAVGEEYDGGYVYEGVNADTARHLKHLKWQDLMSEPSRRRIEDAKVALQAYPWHDLSNGPFRAVFNASSSEGCLYPTALLRLSLSSIPYPTHIDFQLNGRQVDLTPAFLLGPWIGSKDRRWLELELEEGVQGGTGEIVVALTEIGERAPAGTGGKMLTSIEIIEYGPSERFNKTLGHIGAFPTYAMDGKMTLRPTNEACIMRKVNYPAFCPICMRELDAALHRRIVAKQNA